MAIVSICARLASGFDASCVAPVRKYFQQAVVINKTDIETYTITKPTAGNTDYNVEFTLKTGTTGYRFTGPEGGNTFKGFVDKSKGDLGFAQYNQKAQVLVVSNDENSKAILDALDKGSFVVAFQSTDGKVEIFGMENGLSTGDYTYDIQDGGGGTAIVLQNDENAPEANLPLVYKSATPDGETADFDSNFENVA